MPFYGLDHRMPLIVYTSDLHDELDLYRSAGEAAVRTRADALIFGGDLYPGIPSLESLPNLKQEPQRLPVKDPLHTVAVIHSPPFRTKCDVFFDGRHVGSKAVRSWIEQNRPRLALDGHIHESPKLSGTFFDRIGATTVINPGADLARPHLVFIDLDNPVELEHSLYGKKVVP